MLLCFGETPIVARDDSHAQQTTPEAILIAELLTEYPRFGVVRGRLLLVPNVPPHVTERSLGCSERQSVAEVTSDLECHFDEPNRPVAVATLERGEAPMPERHRANVVPSFTLCGALGAMGPFSHFFMAAPQSERMATRQPTVHAPSVGIAESERIDRALALCQENQCVHEIPFAQMTLRRG
jgi:hypothetical protein